jgi:hypothetical protein
MRVRLPARIVLWNASLPGVHRQGVWAEVRVAREECHAACRVAYVWFHAYARPTKSEATVSCRFSGASALLPALAQTRSIGRHIISVLSSPSTRIFLTCWKKSSHHAQRALASEDVPQKLAHRHVLLLGLFSEYSLPAERLFCAIRAVRRAFPVRSRQSSLGAVSHSPGGLKILKDISRTDVLVCAWGTRVATTAG